MYRDGDDRGGWSPLMRAAWPVNADEREIAFLSPPATALPRRASKILREKRLLQVPGSICLRRVSANVASYFAEQAEVDRPQPPARDATDPTGLSKLTAGRFSRSNAVVASASVSPSSRKRRRPRHGKTALLQFSQASAQGPPLHLYGAQSASVSRPISRAGLKRYRALSSRRRSRASARWEHTMARHRHPSSRGHRSTPI
jgi:hypothetical protein